MGITSHSFIALPRYRIYNNSIPYEFDAIIDFSARRLPSFPLRPSWSGLRCPDRDDPSRGDGKRPRWSLSQLLPERALPTARWELRSRLESGRRDKGESGPSVRSRRLYKERKGKEIVPMEAVAARTNDWLGP